MSRVRADKLVDRAATGAPQLNYGAEVPVGYGITGAGGINISGMVTATAGFSGNATGLTGTPDITVNNITGVAATFTGAVSYEDVTNVDSSGIVTAGTCFKAGSVSGGAFGAGVGVTITGDGNAVFSGITTVTYFDATSTLVEAFSSTTTAWNSSGDLNISDGNVQFSSTVLGGTTNTLNIISTAGINTDLAIGQNLSVTGITSVNASTAYVNALNIDGIAQKVWWTGGRAPTAGGGSGMDLYTFNIMKIGSAQFYVIGTQTKTS